MKKLIWGIIVVVLLTACGKSVKKAEITYEEGIKVIKNPLLDFTELEIEPELIISEGESDAELFSNLSDVCEDASGNIYVSDEGENNIKVYTKNGDYIKTIGREGEGPGEFRNPVCIDFFHDGRLIVADQQNQRFQVFSQDGVFLKSYKLEQSSPGKFVVTSNDIIYNKPRMIFVNGNEDLPLFFKYDSDFNQISAIGKVVDRGEMFKTHLMASGHLALSGEDILLAFSMINEMHIYNSDKISEKIIRQLNYEPEKPEIKTVKDGDAITMTAIIDPVCYDVDVDSKGNFYLLSPVESAYSEKSEKPEQDPTQLFDVLLEIFDKDGVILRSIPLRGINSNTVYIGKNDKIYILDSYNMQVLRYPALM